MSIHIKGKPRKPGSDIWLDKHGEVVTTSGRDLALQSEIDEAKAKTKARACFKECHTCGACANSRRDNFQHRLVEIKDGEAKLKSPTVSYDHASKEFVDCRECEPFRYHDCHNGFFRNARGEAEPFTQDVLDLIKKHGGKPLI